MVFAARVVGCVLRPPEFWLYTRPLLAGSPLPNWLAQVSPPRPAALACTGLQPQPPALHAWFTHTTSRCRTHHHVPGDLGARACHGQVPPRPQAGARTTLLVPSPLFLSLPPAPTAACSGFGGLCQSRETVKSGCLSLRNRLGRLSVSKSACASHGSPAVGGRPQTRVAPGSRFAFLRAPFALRHTPPKRAKRPERVQLRPELCYAANGPRHGLQRGALALVLMGASPASATARLRRRGPFSLRRPL